MLDRSLQKEIIDLGPNGYTKEEYDDCLEKLDLIGKWLGGDRATFSALARMEKPPQSILDVGCGGGMFTIKLAKHFPQAEVLGIDLNPYAIEFAKNKLSTTYPPPKKLNFEMRLDPQLNEPDKSFDVVTSTLVCHHIAEEELPIFISSACRIARKRVILNDLHRHTAALWLFKCISPLCFRNRLVQHDGPLSIRRAFKYRDWTTCLQQAGINPSQYRISWHWAFRWIVEINCEES